MGDDKHEAGIEGGEQPEHPGAVIARNGERHVRRGAARRAHATAPKPVHPAMHRRDEYSHVQPQERDDGRKQDEHVRETTTDVTACITSFASPRERRRGRDGLGACVPSGGG